MSQSLKGNLMLQMLELPWREATPQHWLGSEGAADTSGDCTLQRAVRS